jgi:hypothetical protein
MIDPQLLSRAFSSGFYPLPGKCLIELDSIPTMSGLLHIPDSARELRLFSEVKGKTVHGDSSWTGTVLAMTPLNHRPKGFQPEDFKVGDRVLILLLQEDLNQKMIVTANTRVYAVLNSHLPSASTPTTDPNSPQSPSPSPRPPLN